VLLPQLLLSLPHLSIENQGFSYSVPNPLLSGEGSRGVQEPHSGVVVVSRERLGREGVENEEREESRPPPPPPPVGGGPREGTVADLWMFWVV